MNTANLQFDASRLQMTQPRLPGAGSTKVDAAAQDFEAVFISQMLETIWQTVPTDGPMGGGMGESIFRSMMIQDIGRQMAQQGGMGLSSHVKSELLAIQEKGVQ